MATKSETNDRSDQCASPAADNPIDTTDIGINEAEKATRLEKLISHRPDKTELIEKNVLKPGNLDPSLQAKQLELAKNQLEDKLNEALAHRPEPEKLVEEGILTEEETEGILRK